MNCLVISFSGRKNGNCDNIGRIIQEYYGENCKFFSFSEELIHPCGNCGYECFQKGRWCPYITDPEYGLMELICAQDLIYFIVPNYCDYPCANYFIFNERSQCFFQKNPEKSDLFDRIPKRFLVVSNTNTENFKAVLGQNVLTEPDILFLPARKFGKVSIRGDMMESENAKKAVQDFLAQWKHSTS